MAGRGRGRGRQSFAPRPSMGFPTRSPRSGNAAAFATRISDQSIPRAVGPPPLVERLIKLSQEDEFLDFTIECDGVKYQVSRLMISAQSPYFKRACIGPFKEGRERIIDLHEDEPEAVRAMICFFREHGYPNGESEPLMLQFMVFTIADKYQVNDLKDLALRNFVNILARLPIEEQTRTLSALTPQIYAATPADDRLREAVVYQWHSSGTASSAAAELEAVVRDCPAFACDFIRKLMHVAAAADPQLDPVELVYHRFQLVHNMALHSATNIRNELGISQKTMDVALERLSRSGKINQGPMPDSWWRSQ